VRMTEVVADPVLLTTDTDFRVYRRHSPSSHSLRDSVLTRADGNDASFITESA
jgi:hypothetical protein